MSTIPRCVARAGAAALIVTTAHAAFAQVADQPGSNLPTIIVTAQHLRNGTGVGVGAPKYGPRRGFFAGVAKAF